MTLETTVEKVNFVYKEIDENNKKLSENTGLKCIEKCGKCCNNTNIEDSVLAMLPGAYLLYMKGAADKYLEKLNIMKNNKLCIFYKFDENNPNNGYCSEYHSRGLICRLFGFSGIKNKNEEVVFTPCEPIRATDYQVMNKLTNYDDISIMQHFAYKLISIDPYLGTKRYHINEAIRIALEKILFLKSLEI